jgi:hypothetical protein
MKKAFHCFGLLSFVLIFSAAFVPAGLAQSGNFSSVTAISTPDSLVPIPIFSIGRSANVITVSTIDPGNPDQYSQQTNQVGATVTIAQVTADPSNAANGTFVICGSSTPGCVTPSTTTFSYVSSGVNFSAASATQLGLSAVARVGCPLLPTGYFSFCGDSRPGGGVAYPTDGSLVEIISTQDSVGTTIWASSLGDGNSGSNRVTGCEQMFIESGNEWRLECDYMRRYGGSLDIDIKNNWLVLGVGDGGGSRGTGAEIAMNGPREVVAIGILSNRALEIYANANPAGAALAAAGTLRFPNSGTVCWENAESTNGLCQGATSNDKFSVDGGVVTPTYGTSTNCSDLQGQCGNAAAGWIIVPENSASVQVNTTAVTGQSQIFLQEDSSIGASLNLSCNLTIGRTYQITSRTPGGGFRVTASAAPSGVPACLSYHIVN